MSSPNPPVESLYQPDGFANQPARTRQNPSAIPIREWPADVQFVSTIDGMGYRTGYRREQDVEFIAPERREAARYTYGAVSLLDGIERFYYPRMLIAVTREEVQAWLDLQGGAR
jgi:hypothetical protein